MYVRSRDLLHLYSTPEAAYEVKSEPEALYLYLLYALKDRNVGMVEANFASLIFHAMSTLETKLPQLAEDIELGRIDPNLDIDPDIRAKLDTALSPDPARAHDLRQAAEGGKVGLAARLWPGLSLLMAADTGTFDLYAEKLRNTYCKGEGYHISRIHQSKRKNCYKDHVRFYHVLIKSPLNIALLCISFLQIYV